MKNDNNFDKMIFVLQKANTERTEEELTELAKLLQSIDFFKSRILKQEEMLIVAHSLSYQFFEKDSTVIEYGTYGTEFFIILKGSVGIQIPVSALRQDTALFKTELVLKEVAVLGTGKSFGELALIQKRPRAATIICREDCHFAVMKRENYERVLKQIEQRVLNKKLDFLSEIPIFAGWTRRDLAKLHYYFSLKKYLRNHILYKAGEHPTHLYLVHSGEFEVSCLTPSPFGRKEGILFTKQSNQQTLLSKQIIKQICSRPLKIRSMVVRIAGVGGILGEEGYFSDEPYKYTVKCKSLFGEVLAIPIDNLILQLSKHNKAVEYIKLDGFFRQATSEKLISSFHQIQSLFSCVHKEEPKSDNPTSNLSSLPRSRNSNCSPDLKRKIFSTSCFNNRYLFMPRSRPVVSGQIDSSFDKPTILPNLSAYQTQASHRREPSSKIETAVGTHAMPNRSIHSNQAFTLSSSIALSVFPFQYNIK